MASVAQDLSLMLWGAIIYYYVGLNDYFIILNATDEHLGCFKFLALTINHLLAIWIILLMTFLFKFLFFKN